MAKCLGCLVGCFVNMAIILGLYYLNLSINYNETFSIMVASFIAYPFASLAKKYAYFGFRKILW